VSGTNAGTLAPEAEDGIRSVLADLDRQITVARLTRDPVLGHMVVIVAAIRAQHRMFVDGILALTSAQQQPPLLTPAAEGQLIERLGHACGDATRRTTWEAQRQISWRAGGVVAAIAVGAAVLAAVVSGFAVHSLDNDRDIDTASALGAMRADDAAVLARLVRLNPPPSAWKFEQQFVAADGSRAGSPLLRIEPAKIISPATAGR
jgi:hypothetical protein